MPLSVEHEKEEEPVHIASFLGREVKFISEKSWQIYQNCNCFAETKYSQYVAPSMRSVKNSIDSFDWSNLIGKTKNYFGLLRNNEKKDEHWGFYVGNTSNITLQILKNKAYNLQSNLNVSTCFCIFQLYVSK